MHGFKFKAIVLLLALAANLAAMQAKVLIPLVSDGAMQVDNPFCKNRYSADTIENSSANFSDTTDNQVSILQLGIPCTTSLQLPEGPVLSMATTPKSRQIISFFQARYSFFNEVNAPPPRFS